MKRRPRAVRLAVAGAAAALLLAAGASSAWAQTEDHPPPPPTLALQAGKSIRWVADVLGHADPALTLRVYVHAMREAESDPSFADFGGPARPPGGPSPATSVANMARREGLEPPTLRFEA
jgi:hypothetical protein